MQNQRLAPRWTWSGGRASWISWTCGSSWRTCGGLAHLGSAQQLCGALGRQQAGGREARLSSGRLVGSGRLDEGCTVAGGSQWAPHGVTASRDVLAQNDGARRR